MISRGHSGLDSREIADLLECSRSELGSTIGENACGKSVSLVDVVKIELCGGHGVCCLVARHKNNSLCAVVIHYNKDRVEST